MTVSFILCHFFLASKPGVSNLSSRRAKTVLQWVMKFSIGGHSPKIRANTIRQKYDFFHKLAYLNINIKKHENVDSNLILESPD